MTQHISVLLIVNLHKHASRTLMAEIREALLADGVEVTVSSFDGAPEPLPEGTFDLAFSLGGDGTVLYSARTLVAAGVPIIPVNLGSVGFISTVQQSEWRAAYDAWIAGSIPRSERLMFEVTIERDAQPYISQYCMNDAVISADGISKIIRLEVGTKNIHYGHYRADGLIVATPTGSTAYSVAAGGPILDPELDAMILNPVCPFTLSNRSIVIQSSETVRVCVEKEQRSKVQLTIDGQVTVPLEPKDCVCIRCASSKIMLLGSTRECFYHALRAKLNWSGGPDA